MIYAQDISDSSIEKGLWQASKARKRMRASGGRQGEARPVATASLALGIERLYYYRVERVLA